MRIRLLTALCACASLLLVSAPARAQADVKAAVLKHLTTSRDFTLRVAEQMPDADYGFKLTPPQMSFAEQMVHLASEQPQLLAPFTNERPRPSKPASMTKKDVIAFVRQSFDQSIATVSKLTPAQIAKTYSSGEGAMTGVDLLMFLLDHTTHHRASAEMYLRAKGITPTDYQF
ncbi:MAG TPA: DinB family protein [Vicinamibacterales bacterium]|nr:DinB family protein [Vicinamibacterales bacterium]